MNKPAFCSFASKAIRWVGREFKDFLIGDKPSLAVPLIIFGIAGVMLLLNIHCGKNSPTGNCKTKIAIGNNCWKGLSHQHVIDGINYGWVTVGSTGEYEVAAGRHTIEIKHSQTDKACTDSNPIIPECKTSSLQCSY